MKNKKVVIACDHGGYNLKCAIIECFTENSIDYIDVGTNNTESCDYPDYAKKACEKVVCGECDKAVLVCGTGIGMSISANKIKGIRAAVCSDTFSARFTRMHNDANVLCLGERVVGAGLATDIVKLFLETEFEDGGRHTVRVKKISELEAKFGK